MKHDVMVMFTVCYQNKNFCLDNYVVFCVVRRSHSVVARAGDAVDLTCRTSAAWRLCGWLRPGADAGEYCDRLSTSKYDSACAHDSRVRYKVRMRNDPAPEYVLSQCPL